MIIWYSATGLLGSGALARQGPRERLKELDRRCDSQTGAPRNGSRKMFGIVRKNPVGAAGDCRKEHRDARRMANQVASRLDFPLELDRALLPASSTPSNGHSDPVPGSRRRNRARPSGPGDYPQPLRAPLPPEPAGRPEPAHNERRALSSPQLETMPAVKTLESRKIRLRFP